MWPLFGAGADVFRDDYVCSGEVTRRRRGGGGGKGGEGGGGGGRLGMVGTQWGPNLVG